MTPSECAAKLRLFNEWRRGADGLEQPNPTEIGLLIDFAAHVLEQSADPGDVATLEQEARQMRARMERLEAENEILRSEAASGIKQ